jgi:hypothetical protein
MAAEGRHATGQSCTRDHSERLSACAATSLCAGAACAPQEQQQEPASCLRHVRRFVVARAGPAGSAAAGCAFAPHPGRAARTARSKRHAVGALQRRRATSGRLTPRRQLLARVHPQPRAVPRLRRPSQHTASRARAARCGNALRRRSVLCTPPSTPAGASPRTAVDPRAAAAAPPGPALLARVNASSAGPASARAPAAQCLRGRASAARLRCWPGGSGGTST